MKLQIRATFIFVSVLLCPLGMAQAGSFFKVGENKNSKESFKSKKNQAQVKSINIKEPSSTKVEIDLKDKTDSEFESF